jgi:hypothetical protein
MRKGYKQNKTKYVMEDKPVPLTANGQVDHWAMQVAKAKSSNKRRTKGGGDQHWMDKRDKKRAKKN